MERYREETIGGQVIHCGSVDGTDFTLCGLALEGENGDEPMTKVERGKVSCLRCCTIIRFCKTVPLSKVESLALRRRAA